MRVTLRNSVKQRSEWVDSDASVIVGDTIARTLTKEERMAVNRIAEHGQITVSEFARLAGRAWHSAKRVLEGLAEKDIIEQKKRVFLDRDPQAKYVLKKKTSGKSNN